MQFLEADIRRIVHAIWQSVLGHAICSAGHDPPARAPNRAAAHDRVLVTGCVQISGAWQGDVALICPDSVAADAASHMFDVAPEDATVDDMRDAVAELVNIAGGNIKGCLPGPSRLSLPTVAHGRNYTLAVLGNRPLTQVEFECPGGRVAIVLSESFERSCRAAGFARPTMTTSK